MTLQGVGGRKLVNVGNYRLTGKRLGKGNFAKVEEAVHLGLNYKVAVKVMNIKLIKEEYVVRNLYRESRILSKLCHPCIIALFQTMQYGNIYYIVTELVDGSDLCSFIKGQRHGKLEERFTRIYARQLISAIAHMHNLGIVHRDLKMENVMLNSYHTQIKIVDFGLSNIFSEDSPLRTHCGSPEYAAPELFVAGKSYGPEVDVWSLGVILYGMVVGQLPFVNSRESHVTSQERRKKLLAQINLGISGPQRKALAFLSPEFKAMMNKLLIADSSKRITTKELQCHPWITERGRKIIRSNPYKKLDEHTRNLIITELAKMVSTDTETILESLTNDPHGNIAGMYNIVCYNQMSRQNCLDLITKTVPTQLTPRLKKTDSKTAVSKHEGLKSAPVKPSKIPTASPYSGKKSLQSPERGSTTSSKLSAGETKKLKRNVTSADAYNKHSLSPKEETKQKNLKSIYTQRCSASPLQRCSLKSPLRVENRDKSNPDMAELTIKKKCAANNSQVQSNELHVIGNRGVSKALHCTSSNPANPPREPPLKVDAEVNTDINTTTKHSEDPSAVVLDGPRCRSEPAQVQKRVSYTSPSQAAERALKRKSFLPVAASQSTPTKATNTLTKTSCNPRNRRTMSSATPMAMEKSKMANGDVGKRPTTSVTPVKRIMSLKKPIVVDEPIARSIAGYVAHNVGSKLQLFRRVSTTKGEGKTRNK